MKLFIHFQLHYWRYKWYLSNTRYIMLKKDNLFKMPSISENNKNNWIFKIICYWDFFQVFSLHAHDAHILKNFLSKFRHALKNKLNCSIVKYNISSICWNKVSIVSGDCIESRYTISKWREYLLS